MLKVKTDLQEKMLLNNEWSGDGEKENEAANFSQSSDIKEELHKAKKEKIGMSEFIHRM